MKKKREVERPFELWHTAYSWLTACGARPNANYCKEEITTHPDYPSLLSLLDLLDSGGMPYHAVQAGLLDRPNFNYPLLAHIKQPGNEFVQLIQNPSDWDTNETIKYWTGIAVYPQKDAKWENEQNKAYKKNEFENKLFFFGWALAILSLYSAASLQFPDLWVNAFGMLALTGLVTSLFTVGTQLGFQNQVVKKVCGTISRGGCEKVLRSRYAKGFAGFSPAEASFLYFATQFILYLLGCLQPSLLQGLFLISTVGFVIAFWSIYTQAFKLKQWCMLCLIIVFVLILQSVAASAKLSAEQGLLPEILFIALGSLLALIFLPIKKLIKREIGNKYKLTEFRKWKTDASLFLSQWQNEPQVDSSIWHNDLLFGNPDAPLQITVACNPYCRPCAQSHSLLDSLLDRFQNRLKIQVRLLCHIENDQDLRTEAVQAILQKAAVTKDRVELQRALSDWFNWMNYPKWAEKWRPDKRISVHRELMRHSKWMEQSKIAYTPTLFINGRKIPSRYSINDLQALIPQLTELVK